MTTSRGKGEARFELRVFDATVVVTIDEQGHVETDRNMDLLSMEPRRVTQSIQRHTLLVAWNRFVRAVNLGLIAPHEVEQAWDDFSECLADDDPVEDVLSEEHLVLRGFHPFWQFRRDVAADESSADVVLAELATDPTVEVRKAVAGNASCPASVLARLTRDPSLGVRCAVASNEAASSDVLASLVPDEHDQERLMSFGLGHEELFESLAQNPSTPASILKEIARGPMSSDVTKQFVAEHPSSPRETVLDMAAFGIGCASSHPALGREDLLALASSDWPPTRAGIAGSPYADDELLSVLACDEDTAVRMAVAACQRANAALLDSLSADDLYQVRAAVAQNRNTSHSTLVQLASDPDGHVRQGAAAHPDAPEKLLRALATDEWMSVRREVGRNRVTRAFPTVIQTLADDEDARVRRTAALAEAPIAVLVRTY